MLLEIVISTKAKGLDFIYEKNISRTLYHSDS